MKALFAVLRSLWLQPAVWVVLLAGCWPDPIWKPLTPIPVAYTPKHREELVQIWPHGDSVSYWDDVVINHDSISGHPCGTPTPKDVCRWPGSVLRRSVPVAAVDSIRLAYPNPLDGPTGVLGLIAIIALVVTMKT
jgi:hypothetical protein